MKDSIEKGSLYIGCLEKTIVSAMVLNHSHNREYQEIRWGKALDEGQYLVIHALGVHPDAAGKEIGSSMVREALPAKSSQRGKGNRMAADYHVHTSYSDVIQWPGQRSVDK